MDESQATEVEKCYNMESSKKAGYMTGNPPTSSATVSPKRRRTDQIEVPALRIGGVLLFPAFLLIAAPLICFHPAMKTLIAFGSDSFAQAAKEISGLTAYALYFICTKAILIAFSVIILFPFLKAQKRAIKLFVRFMVVAASVSIIGYAWAFFLYTNTGSTAPAIGGLLSSNSFFEPLLIFSSLWIIYFRRSKRVKMTFVN